MKQKILKVAISALLIMTLTMANFLLLCVDTVSYAMDVINIDKSTNHKNVEFMAYFKDENGNKITENEIYANSEDLKLYFKISVKQEGYFNGSIILNDANFKLKTDILSNEVNKIESNTIILNQINANQDVEIEVGVEFLKEMQFDLNLVNMQSEVIVEGVYKNSTQKDISIKSKRDIYLNLINPYKTLNDSIVLSQEVITNKVLKYKGEDKRVIQVEVISGIRDNLFPIAKTMINIQSPKIMDIYPEDVLVNSNDILATNGKMLLEDNWNYNRETGLLNIDIENIRENNRVSWIKNGNDKIIVTYIFDEKIEISDEIIKANSKIEFYDVDKSILEMTNEIKLNDEEKDSIVISNININESNIYKGKLYTGISRDITYLDSININLNSVASEVNVKEEKIIGETSLNSIYKMSKINKSNLEYVLGENGKLNILNANSGSVITSIDKDTKANENEDIIITYPENIDSVEFRMISPEKIGKLEIENTITINSINREIVNNANTINLKSSVSYVTDNSQNGLRTTESRIELRETETSADLQINRTELSAMVTNNNVEFRVILNSKDERTELFKNPVIKIELPEKIQDIQVNSVNLLYEDELKIKSARLNGRNIEIELDGEQTRYKEEAIEGAILIINANLTTNKNIANSTEQVKLIYENQKAINYKDNANIGTDVKNINIVSYAGVVTTNEIVDYGIEIVNNEGANSANLELSTDSKNVKIVKNIINNNENKISNVKILGTFPTKDATNKNNIDIQVGNIEVLGNRSDKVKVYYSTNANATEELNVQENNWKENIEDNSSIKKYLVVIDELDLLEEIRLEYPITIPANLDYNKTAEEGYKVYYTNISANEVVDIINITLSTPKGKNVETTLKSVIAGNEGNTVRENETIRYLVNVANTGSEDVANLKVTAKVPEGTTYINTDKLNNEADLGEVVFEDESKSEVEFNIDKLSAGEELTKYYEVKANRGMASKQIENIAITEYEEVTKASNGVTTYVEEGDLELKLVSVDAEDNIVKSGYQYRYVLYVTNKTNKEMKNVNTAINTSDILKISEIYYIDSNEKVYMEENKNSIEINKIASNETIEIAINTTVEPFKSNELKEVQISAKANINNKEHNSNELTLNAKSVLALSMKVNSENSGKYVKPGDSIIYNVTVKNEGTDIIRVVDLNNWISNSVTLSKVMKNGVELSSEDYLLNVDSEKHQKVLTIQEESIEPNESIEYQIEVVTNLLPGNTKAIEILSDFSLQVDSYEAVTGKIEHILEPEVNTSYIENNKDNSNKNEKEDSNNQLGTETGEKSEYKIISGVAWIDENENGQKDVNEKTVEGIKVRLLDTLTNRFVKDVVGNEIIATTTSTGFYSFDKVQKGSYLVIFEYDYKQYGLTTFEKEGVSNELNSNVISKNVTADEIDSTVAATEIIEVEDNNISNINIGLVTAKKYDLQLDKFISKVTVQNSKTTTNTYTDVTLAKQEIDAKQVNSTTVIVEYTIRVSNKGDVAGYAKKIVDYLSSDYKFDSELNKDWYQSGSDVYCISLANEKIEPGESKEVKLVVIKEMKENNTGLVNNMAEIVGSYNELGLKDINSIENNKTKGENDMGSADLIISIKTGQVIMTVSLIIITVVVLGIAIVLLRRVAVIGKII